MRYCTLLTVVLNYFPIFQLHFDGVTGNIQFSEYGFRKNYNFDVYNVGLNNGPYKVKYFT
jgi:hypothetical protein